MIEFSREAGLWGLFAASFLAATLLPGGSEIALLAFIHGHPDSVGVALLVATTGNTLGAGTCFAVGRLLPQRADLRAVQQLRRYGYPLLLLSWMPLIGDALCVAAGWLRLNPWLAAIPVVIGKLGRYAAVAAGWTWGGTWLAG